jgi:hypothetical protein
MPARSTFYIPNNGCIEIPIVEPDGTCKFTSEDWLALVIAL